MTDEIRSDDREADHAAAPGDGAASAAVLAVRAELLDADGRVKDEHPCRRCGFLLVGLAVEQACPECGLEVRRSLTEDRLVHADPDWLALVSRGLRVALVGIIVGVAFGLAFSVAMGFVGFWLGQTGSAGGGSSGSAANANATVAAVMTGVMVAGVILGAAIQFVTLLGIWWFTTPDPSSAHTETWRSPRTLARWCSFALLVVAPLNLYVAQGGVVMPGTAKAIAWYMWIVLALLLAGQLLVLVGRVAAVHWLARLCERIPDAPRARRLRRLGNGIGASYGVLILATMLMSAIMPIVAGNVAQVRIVAIAGSALSGLGGLAMLILAAIAIVIAVRVDRQLRAIVLEARALAA